MKMSDTPGFPRAVASAVALAGPGAVEPTPLLREAPLETPERPLPRLAGVRLPEGPPAAPGWAADAIRDLLRHAAPGEVTLVGLAPATNLALALLAEPDLHDRVREIVLMTGAWGEGNWTPSAEFNAASDPEALAALVATGLPVSLVTLDLTAQAFVTPAVVERLAGMGKGTCLEAACAILRGVPASRRSETARCTSSRPTSDSRR